MSDAGELILYNADDAAQMQLRASGGTTWLTLSEMATLYGTTSQNIGQIVRHVLEDNEVEESTTKLDFVVRREGTRDVRREVMLYNLDLLTHAGKVRATVAKSLAEERYVQFDDARKHREAIAADLADAESLRALEQKLGEHE